MEALLRESWNGFCRQEQPSRSHNFVYSQLLFDSKINTEITQFPQKWKILLPPKNCSACRQELKSSCNCESPQAPSFSWSPSEAGHNVRQTFSLSCHSHPYIIFVFQTEDIYICWTWQWVHKTQHCWEQNANAGYNTPAHICVADSVLFQSPCAVNCYSLWLWSVGSAVQAPRAACHFLSLSNTQLG